MGRDVVSGMEDFEEKRGGAHRVMNLDRRNIENGLIGAGLKDGAGAERKFGVI